VLRCRGAEVQRCRGAEVQRCRGAEVQRCRGAEVQRDGGTEVQRDGANEGEWLMPTREPLVDGYAEKRTVDARFSLAIHAGLFE